MDKSIWKIFSYWMKSIVLQKMIYLPEEEEAPPFSTKEESKPITYPTPAGQPASQPALRPILSTMK